VKGRLRLLERLELRVQEELLALSLDSVINTIRLHGLPRHRMGREQAHNYLQQFVLEQSRAELRYCSLQVELLQKLFHRQALVGGDTFEDAREGSGLDATILRIRSERCRKSIRFFAWTNWLSQSGR
jgi:hypothetical protein